MNSIAKPLPSGTEQRPQNNNALTKNTPENTESQARGTLLVAANRYLEQGLSIIPAMANKRPALKRWKPYQKDKIKKGELYHHFAQAEAIAVIGGGVSGNIECIDFDAQELFTPFVNALEHSHTLLAKKLVKVKTPHGYHLIYRSQIPVDGSMKLAVSADGTRTLIETRGEGGYFLTYPSQNYTLIEPEKGLETVLIITEAERLTLLTLARSFSENSAVHSSKLAGSSNGSRPGDDYNDRATGETWKNLLQPQGWTFTGRTSNGGEQLIRPGKDNGTSATLKNNCLYVFSTNTQLPVGYHNPFSAYAHILHNGNFATAAKKLLEDGFGNTPGVYAPDEKWLLPLPMVERSEPEPYPVDALPPIMRDAVEEVQAFTKAPLPLVACSALAAASMAVQAHVNVKRAEKLIAPVSLYMLAIADSGERKSTGDAFFTEPIKAYEREQLELKKLDISNYLADMEAWLAKQAGLKAALKTKAQRYKPTDKEEKALRDLEEKKPQRPIVPRYLRGDETPENLAYVLAKEWPTAGVISSEAGAILGSHGMSSESVMRNLALFNILWDGGELSIGRRTKDSFTVYGCRLTLALQVQEATIRNFFEKSGDLARGTGFLARFLVSWPLSTQGSRLYSEPPASWPALNLYNEKIGTILSTDFTVDEDGRLLPIEITMDALAKKKWVVFHDIVERELGKEGEYFEVRDVASKIADNAVRLAAIFTVLNDGMGIGTIINQKIFECAARIAAWHLSESKRFLKELDLPENLKHAICLNSWLKDHCRSSQTDNVTRRYVMQYGPHQLRRNRELSAALNELEDLHRVRVVKIDGQKCIKINPKVLASSDYES